MEQAAIIPTVSKAKISRHLSYPVEAERISAALSSASQFGLIKLHFYSAMGVGIRSVRVSGNEDAYEFLRVEYLNNAVPAEQYPLTHLYLRPPQYRWEIVVQPALRSHRHEIAEYLDTTALPQIKRWLDTRVLLEQQGSDILAFYFVTTQQTFHCELLTRLAPDRTL